MADLNSTAELVVKIPSAKTTDGVTHYEIQIKLGEVSWNVSKRYSSFSDIHLQLVANHGISKDILPPKKLLGNKEPTFIEKRRKDLESYLQSLLNFMPHALPRELAEFLHFQHYEVTFLLQDLARYYFSEADTLLQAESVSTFQPLQLLAISHRFQNPLPTNIEVEQEADFTHVADFCSQVKYLNIEGSSQPYKNSNIIQNNLLYNINTFKSVENLTIINANVKSIEGASSVRKTCKTIVVKNSNMTGVSDMILCDAIHKECMEYEGGNKWTALTDVDFSRNSIEEIGPAISLAPNIERLNLSYNRLSTMDSLTKLPRLVSLNLSHNSFDELQNVNMKLGNVVDLDLSHNNLSSLDGLSKLYSLVSLNVSSNNINDIASVESVCNLPCLESLILNGNIVATVVDYRIKVLELFGSRSGEISLDNEPPTQQELDKVRVLQAIRVAKEGRIPTLELSSPLPSSLVALPYIPPDHAVAANELLTKDT